MAEVSNGRRFPIIDQRDWTKRDIVFPRDIPWSLLTPHEAQALQNHDQTLEELAKRGGLAPCEAVAVIEDREWSPMKDANAVTRLTELTVDAAVKGTS